MHPVSHAIRGALRVLSVRFLVWSALLVLLVVLLGRGVGPLGASLARPAHTTSQSGAVSVTNQALHVAAAAAQGNGTQQDNDAPAGRVQTTQADFFLPGTQPAQLLQDIPDPSECNACHTEPIYDAWRGSMMSHAGRDPLVWAALAVANQDAPGAGEYCLRCHAPKGWLAGRSDPADGSALLAGDTDAGIACEVCHRMVDPVPSTSPDDEARAIDAAIRASLAFSLPVGHMGNAMLIVDPEDNRRGPFSVLPPHSAYKTDFLGQSTHAITEASLCGSCHNVDNPVLSWDSTRNQYWPNQNDQAAPSFAKNDLFPIERTYDEWLNSAYPDGVLAPQFAGAKPDGIVKTCQDCHMPRMTGEAAEAFGGEVEFRDCETTGCLPQHTFAGANTWTPVLLQDARWRLADTVNADQLNAGIERSRAMLQKAATLSVTTALDASGSGTQQVATVRVINETGHKLPTGYPEGRRMWITLQAFDADGALLYTAGQYNPATGILVEDTTVYEAKQGITPELAAEVGVPAGASFHFVLNNTTIKDNRIPPRGYNQAAWDQPGLRPVGAVYTDGQHWDATTFSVPLGTQRVVATLYYQVASKEYIDFLRELGGADGATLGALWDDSKSPPEVMATAAAEFADVPDVTPSPTLTATATGTITPVETPSATDAATSTATSTPPGVETGTSTPTASATVTETGTPTATTPTPSSTAPGVSTPAANIYLPHVSK